MMTMSEPGHPQLPFAPPAAALRHHGDTEASPGLVDLAVNVRAGTPPAWLKRRLAATLDSLAAYPNPQAARRAVAERHGRDVAEVLLTAGVAEAFVLLARAHDYRRPVVVHPQFTEPESALRDAGHAVERVILTPSDGFRLNPNDIPDDADLVIVGNPTNPTSVLHPAAALAILARPGRTLVVDEAFMDAVPSEPESLAGRAGIPGLVVLRSLTKTWGLAGLRVGYLLAAPATVAALQRAQPLWPVSSPALAAVEACCTPEALAEAEQAAHAVARDRAYLLSLLQAIPSADVHATPAGPFILIHIPNGAVIRERLRAHGFAVRRGDTFPGLGPDWLRIAVRGQDVSERFASALAAALGRRHHRVTLRVPRPTRPSGPAAPAA